VVGASSPIWYSLHTRPPTLSLPAPSLLLNWFVSVSAHLSAKAVTSSCSDTPPIYTYSPVDLWILMGCPVYQISP
jgi:hypothetical protein